MRPVTQTADVEVNRQSRKGVPSPEAAAAFTGLAFVTMLFVRHGDNRDIPAEKAGDTDMTVEELTND